jgi:restriction system protein
LLNFDELGMSGTWLAKSQIKQRGWTDGAIKQFLGAPEDTQKNPHYRSGPLMQLWRLETVCEAEKKSEFIAWKSKHDSRRGQLRDRALEQHRQKRAVLLEWVESLAIEVPKYDAEQLFHFSVTNYNDLWSSRGKFEKLIYQDFRDLDPDFLHRITINTLIHALSDYEYHLVQVAGETGAIEARAKLQTRILSAIRETYPDLWSWVDKIVNRLDIAPISAIPLLLQAITTTHGNSNEGLIIRAVSTPWREIAKILKQDFKAAFTIPSHKWEELVAAAFDQAGYDEVTLTPRSGDYGRDVIAVKKDEISIRVIGSVKAFKPGHLVGQDDVRALLGVLSGDLQASKAILTTTSDFAPRIAEDPFIKPFMPYRLQLMNGSALQSWFDKLSAF